MVLLYFLLLNQKSQNLNNNRERNSRFNVSALFMSSLNNIPIHYFYPYSEHRKIVLIYRHLDKSLSTNLYFGVALREKIEF